MIMMKSPLKDRPLRNPGESLDKKIQDFLLDEIFVYWILATLFVCIGIMEWYKSIFSMPPMPWTMTIIATFTVGLAIHKFRTGKEQVRRLRQGRDGEKAVGQYLERLRESGAKTFHDVPGKSFNLDHVVIAKSGIYVVETKTYSKPDKGDAVVVFDGEEILINGFVTKEPVVQVKAAANWLKQLLKDSTGHTFQIKPVVVFPGWFIEPTAEAKKSDVWVLNPIALPSFVEKSKDQLSSENLNMVAFHLSRYIRTCEET